MHPSSYIMLMVCTIAVMCANAQKSHLVYYHEGNKNLVNGRYEEAIASYTMVIHMDTAADYAFFNRASAKHIIDDMDGAMSDYNSAIALNPVYAEAYYGRANLRLRKSDKTGACEDMKKAKDLDYTKATVAFPKICVE